MEGYKERLVKEYRELRERYERLHLMLVKYDANTLEFEPSCPMELLREQADVMSRYMYILEIRAQIEKVDLDGPSMSEVK